MKELKFTLGNSLLWHSFFFEFEMVNEVHDDLLFAYIITQELKTLGIQESAKQVKIYDENNTLIAFSPDISQTASLKYINDETDKS